MNGRGKGGGRTKGLRQSARTWADWDGHACSSRPSCVPCSHDRVIKMSKETPWSSPAERGQ